jgi:hypothetical protein
MTGELSFAEAFRLLLAEAERQPQPSPPVRLALGEIRTVEAVFQPRDVDAAWLASESHVKVLVDAVRENGAEAFDPLTVWWSGAAWYVIDGHHRLMAFREVKQVSAVPVSVFTGPLHSAITRSVALNSKDKLPMRKEDKLERAWKLVCLGGLTKAEIHAATTISTRTVATMRQKRKELVERGNTPLEWEWRDAKQDKQAVIPDDSWAEKLAQDWVRRLVKAFDKKFIEQPGIAARALELYSERLPLELARLWPDAARKAVEEENELEF